jgi:hypothetical protein
MEPQNMNRILTENRSDASVDDFSREPSRGIHYSSDTQSCSPNCTQQLIRERAYELFKQRNGTSGGELADWLQAERELEHHLEVRKQ